MKLFSDTFAEGAALPARCAFCEPDAATHSRHGANRNPQLQWTQVPDEARSLVLLCIDPDSPATPDDANREDRTIAVDRPRTDFFHWVMVDIPPSVTSIAEGACASGVIAGGKGYPPGPAGARQGINSFTDWLAHSDDMAGIYRGYDGPCPPWNDALPHRYRFCLWATDLDTCPVDDDFNAPDVINAVQGHILAQSMLTGLYSLNPRTGTL